MYLPGEAAHWAPHKMFCNTGGNWPDTEGVNPTLLPSVSSLSSMVNLESALIFFYPTPLAFSGVWMCSLRPIIFYVFISQTLIQSLDYKSGHFHNIANLPACSETSSLFGNPKFVQQSHDNREIPTTVILQWYLTDFWIISRSFYGKLSLFFFKLDILSIFFHIIQPHYPYQVNRSSVDLLGKDGLDS